MAKSSEKSLSQRKRSEIQKRLQQAFYGQSLSDIAKELGYNYSSFWNWTSGRTEIPNAVLAKLARKNVSIDYLLTGEGPPLAGRNVPSLEQSIEKKIIEVVRAELQNEEPILYQRTPLDPVDTIRNIVRDIAREIIREEIMAMPIQELGTVDEFLEDQIKKEYNPNLILRNWFIRDGINADHLETMAFSDWDEMAMKDRLKAIKKARGIMKRQKERRANVSPEQTE